MKKLVFLLASMASSAVALGQGVLLEGGQNFVFEFDTIPQVQEHSPSQVIAWFSPSSQVASASLEIFANSLADSPLIVPTGAPQIVEFPSSRIGISYSWRDFGLNAEPPFFPDLQGVLRVSLQGGTAQLLGFDVSQNINGVFYYGYFPVPEPSCSALVLTATACLYLRRKFRTNDRLTEHCGE